MSDFIKCPEGHIYKKELEKCPYCNGKRIEEDLEDLPEKPVVDKDILKHIADCYMVVD